METAIDHQLWQRAVSFAARCHDGQYRKDGCTPYIAHPVRVAFVVRHVFGEADQTALVAALLHDVIENTTTDYDDLIEHFGQAVADAVAALTKDSRLAEQEREQAYDRQLEQAFRPGWSSWPTFTTTSAIRAATSNARSSLKSQSGRFVVQEILQSL